MNILNKQQFYELFNALKIRPEISADLIYEAYEISLDNIEEFSKNNVLGKTVPTNSISLILYLINEFGFYYELNPNKKPLTSEDEVFTKIVSYALDKYLTNEHLSFKNEKIVSKYSPIISTLDVYLNFILGVLKHTQKKNPKETLKVDFLYKGFSIAKAISQLIVDGFETEAFSLWRTLHENECIAILIEEYKDSFIDAYLKHMKYAQAFHGGIPSKEETDHIFEVMKEEMRSLDLKSKDMKKYIEYGWLTSIPNYRENPKFKFNFRDGVERLAGLELYSKIYEMASEVSHSSSLLIYSRNQYYFHLVLLCLYESFFRLETIFGKDYVSRISKEEQARYILMRQAYYPMMRALYEKEKLIFKKINEQLK